MPCCGATDVPPLDEEDLGVVPQLGLLQATASLNAVAPPLFPSTTAAVAGFIPLFVDWDEPDDDYAAEPPELDDAERALCVVDVFACADSLSLLATPTFAVAGVAAEAEGLTADEPELALLDIDPAVAAPPALELTALPAEPLPAPP